MEVAIVGCSHGELDKIYETVEYINGLESRKKKIELLLCCGDFESVRNEEDLQCLACPPKYRQLGCFHEYYSGQKQAPVMTIFIGGNHEASNYLQELYYGGWVAPNIFFLGAAGVVSFGGLRIAGLSGIYKQHDYTKGHFETFPYTESSLRSIYHVREYEIFQLTHLVQPIDIFLSHDWPRGIAQHGDVEGLLRKKSFLRNEVRNNTLGNPATEFLLYKLKPKYWFSAHLHVKFPAIVKHQDESETKFLALDKPLPNRDFLQVLTLERPSHSVGPPVLEMDVEWLAALSATHHLATKDHSPPRTPQGEFTIGTEDLEKIQGKIQQINQENGRSPLAWPFDFAVTTEGGRTNPNTSKPRGNPQTDALLTLLELPHILTTPYGDTTSSTVAAAPAAADPSEIDIDDL